MRMGMAGTTCGQQITLDTPIWDGLTPDAASKDNVDVRLKQRTEAVTARLKARACP
jgi:hypothetical protein